MSATRFVFDHDVDFDTLTLDFRPSIFFSIMRIFFLMTRQVESSTVTVETR